MATPNGNSATDVSSNGAGLHQNGNGNNNAGHIQPTNIVDEMQGAYLDYAMSVIVARALPDVRDGLKPVHRRILYAMWNDLSLTHDKPHKKSARIVGEVLGKYHPHGDVAVYDAMVRMAQDFSLRYPLIDGQGNFGSIDGDNAAAMRYTEARLAYLSDWMLTDIEKDTVNWNPNFDNSLEEPAVLPAAVPNLLINGSSGIAVGMATNIPPHNLGEVVDGLAFMIDNFEKVDEITVDELMHYIKGPDFPTGGIVYRYRTEGKDEQVDAIAQGFAVGKSRLIIQAKAHIEEMTRGRNRIVITELPYQTAKTGLIERIAELVRDQKLTGISDLRDESDRTGMRICIELQRGIEGKSVLGDLFKYTPLQQTFGMQLLALVDGQPRLLTLKRTLHLFIQHRQEIIRKRSEWELARARERAHILEGLLKALDILDEVIATIRRSQTVDTARRNLVDNFKFSEIQAQAILDMQLRRLAALERKKLQDEYDELRKQIAWLEDLLAHPEKILAEIKKELLLLKEKFGDPRRTQIVDRTKGALTTTDLLPDQQVRISLGSDGNLRRQPLSANLSVTQQRSLAKYADTALVTASTRDYLYLFSKDGRCNRVAIHEIPEDGSPKHLAELCPFTRRDVITCAVALPRSNGDAAKGYLFFATVNGDVKRVTATDLVSNASAEALVMNVPAKDRLGWALYTQGNQEVILVTAEGQSIRFGEEDVRSMGLAAGGIGGIKLGRSDSVVYAAVVDPSGSLLTITANCFAKHSPLSEYSSQGRNGSGIVTHKPTGKTGNVVAALIVHPSEVANVLIIPSKNNPQAVALVDIPEQGRGVQGKQVWAFGMDGIVVTAVRLISAAHGEKVKPTSNASPTPSPTVAATPRGASTSPAASPAVKVVANNGAGATPLQKTVLQKEETAAMLAAAAVPAKASAPTKAAEEKKSAVETPTPGAVTTVDAKPSGNKQATVPVSSGMSPVKANVVAASKPLTANGADQHTGANRATPVVAPQNGASVKTLVSALPPVPEKATVATKVLESSKTIDDTKPPIKEAVPPTREAATQPSLFTADLAPSKAAKKLETVTSVKK